MQQSTLSVLRYLTYTTDENSAMLLSVPSHVTTACTSYLLLFMHGFQAATIDEWKRYWRSTQCLHYVDFNPYIPTFYISLLQINLCFAHGSVRIRSMVVGPYRVSR